MKRYNKNLIGVFCIVIIITFYFGYLVGKKENSVKNITIVSEPEIDNKDKEDMKNAIYVSGMLAPYKNIDREINLKYFYGLNDASTYEQITKEIGEPNGWYGSGIIYKYYEITNDLYVSILFSENDRAALIRLCNQKEILDTIYPQ